MEISKQAASLLIMFILVAFTIVFDFSLIKPASMAAMAMINDNGKIIERVQLNDPGRRDSLVLMGDIMLARDVERRIARVDKDYPFLSLKELMRAKVVVGNFEAAIPRVHKPTPDFGMSFSVKPENLETLVRGGLTHLSLANNHALDHGEAAYLNTLEQLRLYGFAVAGHPRAVSTDSVSYFNISGTSIALININAVFGYPPESEWRPVLEKAQQNSEIQIIYIHWGEEYVLTNNSAQQRFAHTLIDAGVDMIVGHHPHVVQNIELYNGALIFYSLGNFLFDQYFSDEVQTGLAIEFKKSAGWQVLLHPIESKSVRIQPRELVGDEKSDFLYHLAARSGSTLREEIISGTLSTGF